MRVVSDWALIPIVLSATMTISGCTKPVPAPPTLTTVSISVDMPKVQTLQFIKQSASKIKLNGIETTVDDTVTAGKSKAVVSGPASGPVTAVFTGDDVTVNQWSQMILDKMPSKRL